MGFQLGAGFGEVGFGFFGLAAEAVQLFAAFVVGSFALVVGGFALGEGVGGLLLGGAGFGGGLFGGVEAGFDVFELGGEGVAFGLGLAERFLGGVESGFDLGSLGGGGCGGVALGPGLLELVGEAGDFGLEGLVFAAGFGETLRQPFGARLRLGGAGRGRLFAFLVDMRALNRGFAALFGALGGGARLAELGGEADVHGGIRCGWGRRGPVG